MPERRTPSDRSWQVVVGLVAALLYLRTVGFGWVFDDPMEIVLNTTLHSLRELPTLFVTTVWAGSGMETYLYRPLTMASLALNHAVSGLEPWSYHLVNVLLHGGVSVLVFRLGRLWSLSGLAAGVGALLFAVHPVHVEVVAAAHGRKDLLAALFVMATVLTHRRAVTDASARAWVPALIFGCALLSKEVGVAAVALVLAHDLVLEADRRAFLRRTRVGSLYASYMVLLLLYAVVRIQVTGGLQVPETSAFDNPLIAAAGWVAPATALAVVGVGFSHLALPVVLSPDYSFNAIPLVGSPADPRLLLTLVVLGMAVWALTKESSRPWGLLALCWYSLTLLPASNLLIGIGTIFADRLLYLPSVAACLVVGAALALLVRRAKRPGVVAVAAVAVLLTVQSWRYTSVWTDDVTLFRWAVQAVPESTKAHHKLGEELLRAGDVAGAITALERALEIAPGNAFAAETLRQARQAAARRR